MDIILDINLQINNTQMSLSQGKWEKTGTSPNSKISD